MTVPGWTPGASPACVTIDDGACAEAVSWASHDRRMMAAPLPLDRRWPIERRLLSVPWARVITSDWP